MLKAITNVVETAQKVYTLCRAWSVRKSKNTVRENLRPKQSNADKVLLQAGDGEA